MKAKNTGVKINAETKFSLCKCGGEFKYIEREGYVCQACGWTKLFKP